MSGLESFVQNYGYGALLLGTILEGETVLILAGIMAHMGLMKLPAVILVAFAGSLLGDQLYFFWGRRQGTVLLEKHPVWKRRSEKVYRALRRYRNGIMLGFRFVYGMRTITPLILGMDRSIPARWFFLLNAAGAALWSIAIALGGYYFGEVLKIFLEDIRRYEVELLLVIVLIGAVVRLVIRYREKKKAA
ncbi:MAG: Inner membrane protein YohD [Syntrophaceae bacterium PtaU1.Bin231]|nr:MAG: Inner membrane protein YohD [Syntrophaceae bacterium PtaU1.Bin231]